MRVVLLAGVARLEALQTLSELQRLEVLLLNVLLQRVLVLGVCYRTGTAGRVSSCTPAGAGRSTRTG